MEVVSFQSRDIAGTPDERKIRYAAQQDWNEHAQTSIRIDENAEVRREPGIHSAGSEVAAWVWIDDESVIHHMGG